MLSVCPCFRETEKVHVERYRRSSIKYVIELIFRKLNPAGFFVKKYDIEFHDSPTNGWVTVTKPHAQNYAIFSCTS